MIDGKVVPMYQVLVEYENETLDYYITPWGSLNPDMNEIKENIMKKYPFVNEEQINFVDFELHSGALFPPKGNKGK